MRIPTLPTLVLAATAFVLAARASGVREEEPVRLVRARWEAGEVVESQARIRRTYELRAKVEGEDLGPIGRDDEDSRREKEIEVLAVEDGVPTRIRVRYVTWTTERPEAEEESPEAEHEVDLEGLTFVLTHGDDGVEITDEEGEALAEEVEAAVREEEVSDGESLDFADERLEDLLAESARSVGEVVEVPAELARSMLAQGGEEPESASMSLELVELREIDGVRCAVFRTSVRIEDEQDGFETEVELEGETWISVETGRYVGGEVEGELRSSAEQATESGDVELSGEGTLEIRDSRRYTRS